MNPRRSSFSGKERPAIVLEPDENLLGSEYTGASISLSIHPATPMDERGGLSLRPTRSDLSIREVALLSKKLEEQWVEDHAAQGESGLQVEGEEHKVQFSPIPETHTIPRDQAFVPLESEYFPPQHTPPSSPPHRRSTSGERRPGERAGSIGRPSSRLGASSFASDLSLREVELLEEKLEERGEEDREGNEEFDDDVEEGGRRSGPALSKVSFSPKPSIVNVPRDQVPVPLSLDGRPPSRGASPASVLRRSSFMSSDDEESPSGENAGGGAEDLVSGQGETQSSASAMASDMSLRELDLLEEKMAEKRDRADESDWTGPDKGQQGQVRFKGVAVVPVPKDQEHIPIEDEIDDIRIHSASTRSSSRKSSTEHLRSLDPDSSFGIRAADPNITPSKPSDSDEDDEETAAGRGDGTAQAQPVGRYASDLSIKEIDMLEKVLDERDTTGDGDDSDTGAQHGKVLFSPNAAVVHVPRDQPAIPLDDELVTRSHGSLPHTPVESVVGDGESVASDLSHKELAMLEERLLRERTASGELDDPRRGGDRVAFSPTPPEIHHVGKDQPRVRIAGVSSSTPSQPDSPSNSGAPFSSEDIETDVPIIAGVVLGLGSAGGASTDSGTGVERWASDLSLREMQFLERKREEKEDDQLGVHKVSFSRKASVVRVERDEDSFTSVEDLLQSAKRTASPGFSRSPSSRTSHLLDPDDVVPTAEVESTGTTAFSVGPDASLEDDDTEDFLKVPAGRRTGTATANEVVDGLHKVGSDLSIREVEILERKLAASPNAMIRSQSRDSGRLPDSTKPISSIKRKTSEGYLDTGGSMPAIASGSSDIVHP
ncbi:hypothetical protein HDU93_001407, partial [Gonapodya sp. JEL0774]